MMALPPVLSLPPTPAALAGLFGLVAGWARRARGEPAAPVVQPRTAAPPESAAAPAPAGAPAPSVAAPGHPWPDFTDLLWGPGFALPGGAAEALRLAGLLPLSAETVLLLLEAGGGGVAAAIGEARKSWVSGHDSDPLAVARAARHLRKHGKRLSVAAWDPAAPAFRPGQHNHAMVLEALGRAGDPARLLSAVAGTLKTGGQIVMTDLVRPPPVEGESAEMAAIWRRWLRLERRVAPPPLEKAMGQAFRRAGFQLHVTEPLDEPYALAVLEAWLGLIRGLERREGRLAPLQAALLVAEAERWLLRLRLMGLGRLHLRRWHATLGR
jgi:hypothetical protein